MWLIGQNPKHLAAISHQAQQHQSIECLYFNKKMLNAGKLYIKLVSTANALTTSLCFNETHNHTEFSYTNLMNIAEKMHQSSN